MSRVKRTTDAPRLLVAVLLMAVAFGGTPRAVAGRVAAAHHASADPTTLTIGWSTETKVLDPSRTIWNADMWVFANIYDQLFRVGSDGTTLIPDLATRWTITNGGTVYTFHLRPGVVFQNGQKLTAADVKFCIDRARQPAAAWSWTLSAIKAIEAPDDATVRITLRHRWAPLLSDLSHVDTGVYPAAYFQKVGAAYFNAHPIGTGPYMLESWKRGQYLRLKKNPRYWWASRYPMQHVEFDLIPNDNTRLLKVEAGELDVDNVLPYNQVAQVQHSQTAQVQVSPSTQINYLLFNTKVKPFDEVNVRQAISHAIDRAAIVKAVLYGYGQPANSFMPRGAIDYNPAIPVPSFDLGLARRLLSKSSVPHGFNMTFEVASGDTMNDETAVIFKAEMAPLGINVTIRPMDQTTLFANEAAGKYHFAPIYWTNDIPDPDEIVSAGVDYTQGNRSFFTWYDNPELTALSRQAEQSDDNATRQRLYDRIQEIWARDMPFLALDFSPFVNAVGRIVHGFSENPLGYFMLQGVHKS